jgi:ribonucleoside-diphosphate reductase alpha chain
MLLAPPDRAGRNAGGMTVAPADPDRHPAAPRTRLRPRPAVLRGTTRRTETPVGEALVTVNTTEEGEPFEVFVRAGQAGSDLAGLAEAIGRLCSLCLQLPGEVAGAARLRAIADELRGIGGAQSLGPGRARSLADAVARVLGGEDAAGDDAV